MSCALVLQLSQMARSERVAQAAQAELGLAVLEQDVLDEVEAEHVDEERLHLLDVGAVEQRVIHADRRDAALGGLVPRWRVDVAHAVADVGLLRVQLDEVARRDLEANTLTGLQQVAGRDAFGGDAVVLEVGFERGERGIVGHLEAVEVHAGLTGVAQDEAVVIALVPPLEVGASCVATCLHQADDVRVELDRFVEVEDLELHVPGSEHSSDCHVLSPC